MKDDDLSLRSFRLDLYERVEGDSAKLVTAARNGDLETVRRLVEGHEITIDAVDGSTRETAFAAALAAKRKRMIEYMLAHGAHVFAQCIVDGKTEAALVSAVEYGDVSLISRFAGYESLLNKGGPSGRVCPLTEAMKLGTIDMVEALLEIGFSAAPLQPGVEIRPSHPSDVQVLRPMFAPFPFGTTTSDDKTPWRLLELACWLNDRSLIEYLFEMFDVYNDHELMATRGTRALRLAVCRQNARLVTELLDQGVLIYVAWAANAMVVAVLLYSVEMMHLLMNHGGDITICLTNFGFSASCPQGLLVNALTADAMDCAYELLRLETRPEFLD